MRATGLLDTGPEGEFDALARTAATVLGTRYALVTLVDDQRSYWKSRIGLPGRAGSGRPAMTENTVDESFSRHVVDSGEPLVIGDVQADPVLRRKPLVSEFGVASWAGVPLRGPEGDILGTFCVADTVTRMWGRRDLEVLRQLSEAASREIELRAAHRAAAELAAERDLALARVQLLADIGREVSATLDIGEAVARLARLVVPTLGDLSIVSLFEPDGRAMRDVGWWHADPARLSLVDEFVADRWDGLVSELTAQVSATSDPVIVRADAVAVGLARLRAPRARRAWAELAVGSFALFPLVAGGRVFGTLSVAREAASAQLTDKDGEIGVAIADRAAVAIENARLYAESRRTATHHREVSRALQDAMLSSLPQPDHVRLVARYRTAASADQVGGDWYDAVVSTDGALTVAVGDVAGHDIAAATVMGQVRNVLRAFIWNDAAETPAALISRLDHAMRDLGLRTMATLTVLRVEQTEADRARGLRTLRWSCAGHPPAVLVDAAGHATPLPGGPDLPLGVEPSWPRHDRTCTVTPGSTVLLYTDGLLETRALDHDDRLSLLLDSLPGLAGAAPDELVDSVLTTMVADQQDDDVAVLVLRFGSVD